MKFKYIFKLLLILFSFFINYSHCFGVVIKVVTLQGPDGRFYVLEGEVHTADDSGKEVEHPLYPFEKTQINTFRASLEERMQKVPHTRIMILNEDIYCFGSPETFDEHHNHKIVYCWKRYKLDTQEYEDTTTSLHPVGLKEAFFLTQPILRSQLNSKISIHSIDPRIVHSLYQEIIPLQLLRTAGVNNFSEKAPSSDYKAVLEKIRLQIESNYKSALERTFVSELSKKLLENPIGGVLTLEGILSLIPDLTGHERKSVLDSFFRENEIKICQIDGKLYVKKDGVMTMIVGSLYPFMTSVKDLRVEYQALSRIAEDSSSDICFCIVGLVHLELLIELLTAAGFHVVDTMDRTQTYWNDGEKERQEIIKRPFDVINEIESSKDKGKEEKVDENQEDLSPNERGILSRLFTIELAEYFLDPTLISRFPTRILGIFLPWYHFKHNLN